MAANNTSNSPDSYPAWVIALHVIPLVITIVGTLILNVPVFVTAVLTDFHRKKPVNVWLNIMVFVHIVEGLFTLPIFLYRSIRGNFDADVEKYMCVIYRFINYGGTDILAVFIVLISFDRLVSVCFPLRYKTWMSARWAYIIAAAAIVAILFFQTVPLFVIYSDPKSSDKCPFKISPQLYVGVMIFFFIIPEFLLLINYGIVLHKIRSTLAYAETSGDQKEDANRIRSRKATHKIMSIVLVYMFTHLPYVIYFNLEHFRFDIVSKAMSTRSRSMLKTYIRVASQVEGFCTPLVYFWTNDDFREVMFKPFRSRMRESSM